MQKEIKNIILLALFLIGLILIGINLNGMVVSQSCCFPPNCIKENLCSAGTIVGSTITNPFSLMIGAILFVSTLSVFLISKQIQKK